MAEGPQVRLRTEWIKRWTEGRSAYLSSAREDLAENSKRVSGSRVDRVDCYGKHIFIHFDTGDVLHNHLLMKGRWRRYKPSLLIPPEHAWMTLDTGEHSVCNLNGQMMAWTTLGGVAEVISGLGPDVMQQPYPVERIEQNFARCDLPISEALLDQSILAGIGNIAKSEILFTARLDPRKTVSTLNDTERDRLHTQIQAILWESYHTGGRWKKRVYQRSGVPCAVCGCPIESTKVAPSRRATYYCPNCQTEPLPSLF